MKNKLLYFILPGIVLILILIIIGCSNMIKSQIDEATNLEPLGRRERRRSLRKLAKVEKITYLGKSGSINMQDGAKPSLLYILIDAKKKNDKKAYNKIKNLFWKLDSLCDAIHDLEKCDDDYNKVQAESLEQTGFAFLERIIILRDKMLQIKELISAGHHSGWRLHDQAWRRGRHRNKRKSHYQRRLEKKVNYIIHKLNKIIKRFDRKINHPPVADNQSVTTDMNVAIPIILQAADPDGDPLAFILRSLPAHGTLSQNGDSPTLNYVPNNNYAGPDIFTFSVHDGRVTSNIATVNITILNQAPNAQSQSLTTDANTTLPILLGATDPDGNPLSYIIVASPAHGLLTQNGSGPDLTYKPDTDYIGPDEFTFKANDGNADSNVATVSIEVLEVLNQAPIAFGDLYSMDENSTLDTGALGVLDNDKDHDGDSITAEKVSNPLNGAITVFNSDGSFQYKPNTDFSGLDTFTYKAFDGTDFSNVASVTINIVPVQTTNADLGIDKSGHEAANVGDNVQFVIRVTNNGPASALNVIAVDKLPAELSIVSFSTDQGTYNSSTGIWTIGNLTNGQTVNLDIIANASAAGEITNTATVASNSPDSDQSNNQNSHTITIGL